MDRKAGQKAWIDLPSDEHIRSLPMEPLYDYGFIATMSRLLVAHPRIGPAFVNLFVAIMFGPGALARTEREMVASVAALAQDCAY